MLWKSTAFVQTHGWQSQRIYRWTGFRKTLKKSIDLKGNQRSFHQGRLWLKSKSLSKGIRRFYDPSTILHRKFRIVRITLF
jgi:hypothetical protein